MMYDSIEFSYRDFTETLDLEDRFDTDNLLFSHEITESIAENIEKVATPATGAISSPVKNNLLLSCNNSGQYFSIATESIDKRYIIQNDNTDSNFVQAQNSFCGESTLLDENLVDQFLIPSPISSKLNEDEKNNGPDILALFSCVICHDIFTTDADLLDHTILMHASVNLSTPENSDNYTNSELQDMNSSTSFDSDWLVCCICERVLSMALEIEPHEQLCCLDADGKGCVGKRKLDAMFVCDVCNYLFADGEALDRHKLTCVRTNDEFDEQKIFSEKGDLSCSFCGQKFSTEIELKSHEESHRETRPHRTYKRSSDNKMWNCGSCNQLFATARELYRHKRGEDRPPGTPSMAYVCDECDKVLGSMCALHTHKKMHKVTKPGYPCKICGRRFNQSGHLAIHMRMHTGERPYPCDLCSKAFKVKVERDDHRRTHTGERPFACSACPKTFTAAARLREHARIHTDQRPYICDICGAAFRRPYARTVHTLIHTGQKPHECDVCGTAFRRSGDMWKHKRTLHGIQPTDIEAK